jgi:RNA polymerase sigma factor (sigma-70 family)
MSPIEADTAVSDAREQEIAELIVTVARPKAAQLVERYTRFKSLRPEDSEDIVSTVCLRLMVRLRSASPETSILQLEDYVSRLTFNALNDHFRRRFPQRARLKNRVRYVLTHDPRLGLWPRGDGLVCGLAEWKGKDAGLLPSHPPLPLLQQQRENPAAALMTLFESSGEPLLLDMVVDLFADLWHLVDIRAVPDAAPVQPTADMTFEWREFLAALWREAVQLRPMQRRALLLNLRDAETAHVLSLIVFTGIATLDELAQALDMTRIELDAIWNDLPLDDLRIAEMLNITRQQVINLRKSARERLARRLAYQRTGS